MARKKRNPASSASQYGAAQAVLSGHSSIMPKSVARELVDATPERLRVKFARELAARRARRGNTVPYGHRGRYRNLKPKKRKKRNPEIEDRELKAAGKMYRKFTGKKASGFRVVAQKRVTPSALADCGRMVALLVETDEGHARPIKFKESGAGVVRCGTTGDGGQLYFVGGDQEVNPRAFGATLPKDQVALGPALAITYFTSKDFHNFDPSEYEHWFGKEDEKGDWTGEPPMLCYDVQSERLYLVGGTYRVRREGIVN